MLWPWCRVGVTHEANVRGKVRDISLEPRVAKVICSDPEGFRQFVGERVVGRNVTGALFVFVLTLDVPGCPRFPVCVLRRAHGVADDEVLHRSREILAIIAEMGIRVTRVATDGDRKFTTVRGAGWEALQKPGVWALEMPIMAQGQLIAVARWLSGCFY
jgi:hypothetical protein